MIGWPANHLPIDDVQMIIVWNCKGNQSKNPVKLGKRSEASALKSTNLINFAIGMSCIVMYMFDDVRSYPICNQELPQTPIKNGVCSILFQLKSIADKHVQSAPNST